MQLLLQPLQVLFKEILQSSRVCTRADSSTDSSYELSMLCFCKARADPCLLVTGVWNASRVVRTVLTAGNSP